MSDLGRRVVACKIWRQMGGMQWWTTYPGGLTRGRSRLGAAWPIGALPDLDDPLTRLGLLHLVREAWNDPFAGVKGHKRDGQSFWTVTLFDGERMRTFKGATEAEALVVALEGAP